MLIPKRYGYFVFGFIQSGFTCAVAAGIASLPFLGGGMFISEWLRSWLIAWIIMTPFVLVAAPFINRAVAALTRWVRIGAVAQRRPPDFAALRRRYKSNLTSPTRPAAHCRA
jgi:cell division protein FtsW (lipid II flippase)